MLMMTK